MATGSSTCWKWTREEAEVKSNVGWYVPGGRSTAAKGNTCILMQPHRETGDFKSFKCIKGLKSTLGLRCWTVRKLIVTVNKIYKCIKV